MSFALNTSFGLCRGRRYQAPRHPGSLRSLFCSTAISIPTWALGPAPTLGHRSKTQVLTIAWNCHSFTWQVHPVPVQVVYFNRFLLKANQYARRTAPLHVLWMLHAQICALLSSLQKPEINQFQLRRLEPQFTAIKQHFFQTYDFCLPISHCVFLYPQRNLVLFVEIPSIWIACKHQLYT